MKRLVGLELLRNYSRSHQRDNAGEIAMRLNRLYPDDPEVIYHAGRIYGDMAYQTMRRLSQVAPDSVWVHQAAGEAHEVQGHYELAIVEYQKVASLDPGRSGIHFRLGRAISLRGEPTSREEALREFEMELQLDPTNVGAAYEVGEIQRKDGQLVNTIVATYPGATEQRWRPRSISGFGNGRRWSRASSFEAGQSI